jgi:hypothetical protein
MGSIRVSQPLPRSAVDHETKREQKRAYASPQLTAYGSIKELTKGNGTGAFDGSRPHKF